MLKKLLLTLFPFLAVSCDKPKKPDNNIKAMDEIKTMDPNDILFSLATLCDPIPATQSGLPSTAHQALHEDDWRQIEFVALANQENIQSKLTELAAFKKTHGKGLGFTQVFIRPEHPRTFESAGLTTAQLPRLTESALSLGGGTVPGGFALADGGDWFIYGQRSPDGRILHLAVSPGGNTAPSEQFLRALADLAGTRFLLVDWYAGVVVDTTSPGAILTWASRFR